jgi:hypothetical protein
MFRKYLTINKFTKDAVILPGLLALFSIWLLCHRSLLRYTVCHVIGCNEISALSLASPISPSFYHLGDFFLMKSLTLLWKHWNILCFLGRMLERLRLISPLHLKSWFKKHGNLRYRIWTLVCWKISPSEAGTCLIFLKELGQVTCWGLFFASMFWNFSEAPSFFHCRH